MKPWNQAIGTQGGTRTHDLEGWGTFIFYQLNYLRLTHQHKTFLAFGEWE